MRPDEWTPRRRDAEDRSRRQRVKASVPLDECEARQLGRRQQAAQAQLLAQFDAFGLLDEQCVGAAVDRVPVDLLAEDDAAETRPAFEQHERYVLSMQFVRRRQTANPAADDDDGTNRVHLTIITSRGRAIRGRR